MGFDVTTVNIVVLVWALARETTNETISTSRSHVAGSHPGARF
jgi:hypothetical protein